MRTEAGRIKRTPQSLGLMKRLYFSTRVPFCQAGKEKILKIHIDLPWGGHLHIERELMSMDKFRLICALAAGGLVVLLLLGSTALKG